MTQFDGPDLNLLIAFDALVRERNVTRAAAAIGVSQPTLSNALAKLRTIFGDPLFVRTPRAMVPTARAVELTGAVRQVLTQVRALVEPPNQFAASTSRRCFTIATTDYCEIVLLPHVMKRLRQAAPHVVLSVRPLKHGEARAALESGELDMAIAWRLEEAPFDAATMVSRTLFHDDLVCLARRDHPVLRRSLSLEQFIAADHVVAAASDDHQLIVDSALAQRGLRRHICAVVPHFLAVPFLVAHTDAVATVAARVVQGLSRSLPVRTFRPPLPFPQLTVRLIWHASKHADRGHVWLRKLLSEPSIVPVRSSAPLGPRT